MFSKFLFLAFVAFFDGMTAGGPSGHFVSIGDHRLFIDCLDHQSAVTVILESGAGVGHEAWSAVQPKVGEFARVCSYDRADLGRSDTPKMPDNPESIVANLHELLVAEHIPGPYVLVGASLGGVYVRRFTSRYPEKVLAMVLVDSSHEEQYGRYYATSPSVAERFATQDGRFAKNDFLRNSGQLPLGGRLSWHYDIPLIVLEHKRLHIPQTPVRSLTEADRLAMDWHALQVDLASRSNYGELREAGSGHFIAGEQPDIVVQSIHEVIEKIEFLKKESDVR